MVPPRIMVIGKVTTHAVTIPFAVPHFTADTLFAVPAPITEVVITWVVLTGAPKKDIVSITIDAEVSAAKPLAD